MTPPATGADILVTLAGINKGRAAAQATDMLAEVVQAVQATGGKGSVTMKLSVGPLKGMDGSVEDFDGRKLLRHCDGRRVPAHRRAGRGVRAAARQRHVAGRCGQRADAAGG